MSRPVVVALAVLTVVAGIAVGIGAGALTQGGQGGRAAAGATPTVPAATRTPAPMLTPGATIPPATLAPTPTPSPTPVPTPTPEPTPVLVPAPLTGMPVTEDLARRHVIAVMIDDQYQARPQSGLSDASVVWHAPAEGGIPRYMALFAEGNPPSVGPVRSARLYYIAWASEWNSVYVHSGGSPQAKALLATKAGHGKLVYNADEYRWGNRYLWRSKKRSAPHNVYTDGKNLQKLGRRVGAKPYEAVPAPVWQFAPDAPLAERPEGTKLVVPYLANKITYTYDRTSNRYLRSVSHEGKQVDAGTKERIAPKNVVVMVVSFATLNDKKRRLEAQVTGSGRAWISTNGRTIKGTWRKDAFDSPTRFYGPDDQPVTLTAGQTFVQVVPTGTKISIKDGAIPDPSPGASAAPSPSPSGATGLVIRRVG